MLNGWLWCDRSRKHCQDFTCSSFTKSFCICINLWRYILSYLESIFYSFLFYELEHSEHSLLIVSWHVGLTSVRSVDVALLRRSLRFCWRQSIECSFRFPTRRLAQIRRCTLWNFLWAESIWVSSVWVDCFGHLTRGEAKQLQEYSSTCEYVEVLRKVPVISSDALTQAFSHVRNCCFL